MRLLPRVVRFRLACAIGYLWGLFVANVIAYEVGQERGVWDEQSQIHAQWRLRRWLESAEARSTGHSIDQFFRLV